MSKVSDIYNYLVALAKAEVPTYKELADRVEPEANDSIQLRKGILVGIGEESQLDREICPSLALERSYTIVLTNEITSTDTNVAKRVLQELALLEDAFLIIKAIENDPDLGENAVNASYVSQSGVEYLVDEETSDRFLAISIEVAVEYHQQI